MFSTDIRRKRGMFKHCFVWSFQFPVESGASLRRCSKCVLFNRFHFARRGPSVCRGECKKTGGVRSEKCFRELFNDSRSARSNYLRRPQVIPSVKAERDWTMGRFLFHCDELRDFAKFHEILVCFRDWVYSSTNFCCKLSLRNSVFVIFIINSAQNLKLEKFIQI